MTNPFKTKEFSHLRDFWDRKLKESGFKDAERFDKRSGEAMLVAWDSFYFQARNTPVEFEIKHQYYHQAFQFLHSFSFPNKHERHVWQLHCEGVGVREIAKSLIERGIQTNKDSVARVVNHYKALMKEPQTESCKKPNLSQLDLWTPTEEIQDSYSKPGSRGSDIPILGSSASTNARTSQRISKSSNGFSQDQVSQLTLLACETIRT